MSCLQRKRKGEDRMNINLEDFEYINWDASIKLQKSSFGASYAAYTETTLEDLYQIFKRRFLEEEERGK